jgi:hypothetical protein
MLKMISWMQWLTTVGCTICLYYVVVIVRYYRSECYAFFKGLVRSKTAKIESNESEEERPE